MHALELTPDTASMAKSLGKTKYYCSSKGKQQGEDRAGGEGKEGGKRGEAYGVQLVRTGNNSCSLDSVCLLFGVLHTC